jgi:hypothetical protein
VRNGQAKAHTFVVRVWVEEPGGGGRPGVWRGHVTHVLEGTRKHVQDLNQISEFIARYLREMDIEPEAPAPGGSRSGGDRLGDQLEER